MSSPVLRKRNVLVVISSMGQFPEMYRIAELLKSGSEFNPIIYFNLGIYGGHPNVALCLENGIDIWDYNFGYVQSNNSVSKEKPVAQVIHEREVQLRESSRNFKLKQFIKHKTPVVFEVLKGGVYYYSKNLQSLGIFYRAGAKLKRLRKEKKLLEALNVQLMIFGEDSEDYFTPQLIKLGRERSIKSVVFPYTFANQFEFLEDAHFNDRRVNRNVLNYLTGKMFPKWTYHYNGKKLLKSSPSLILTSEFFKASPPNPWVMSSGYADVIAVESRYMKEYYREAGIPDQQMMETGYLSLDRISQTHSNRSRFRQTLADELGIDAQKPWVLCAVPPSQWPRAAVGFQSYDQFLNDFVQYFSKFKDVEVLFKFHPRLDSNYVRELCRQYGIKFITEDTASLVTLSDAYIASSSSTLRWSLALGIPTINYDAYNYNYGDFKHAENFDTVVSFNDFQDRFVQLHKKLKDSAENAKCSFQNDFAVLDGNAHQRISDLFSNLTASH